MSQIEQKLEHKKHRRRHRLLHKRLDELVADFISDTGKLPSKTSILKLMKWSNKQTKISIDEKKEIFKKVLVDKPTSRSV